MSQTTAHLWMLALCAAVALVLALLRGLGVSEPVAVLIALPVTVLLAVLGRVAACARVQAADTGRGERA